MSVELSRPDAAEPAAPPAAPAPSHDHPNQFALLGQRRFAPFFWTQFSGAANDNLFKFSFTVMVTYQLSVSWLPPALAGLAIAAAGLGLAWSTGNPASTAWPNSGKLVRR